MYSWCGIQENLFESQVSSLDSKQMDCYLLPLLRHVVWALGNIEARSRELACSLLLRDSFPLFMKGWLIAILCHLRLALLSSSKFSQRYVKKQPTQAGSAPASVSRRLMNNVGKIKKTPSWVHAVGGTECSTS